MNLLFKNKHPIRRGKSFKYAFEGLFHALINEPNFRIQVVITVISVFMGFMFKISGTEWAVLTLAVGGLLSAEMVNTVIEEIIDNFVQVEHPTAKIAKDLGSGFVLVAAIATSIILWLIFAQRISQAFI